MTVPEWKSKGKFIVINGFNLFVIDAGKKAETLVILHGFPTSSYDFHLVLPELCKKFRVVIHDQLGYGFSEKPVHYSYSLIEQADMALGLWQHLKIKKAHILAHDMGTSVATEILARDQRSKLSLKIESVTLTNGSMHIEMAKLRILQKLLHSNLMGSLVARLSSKLAFKIQMKRLWYDTSDQGLSEELDNMWLCLQENNGRLRMPQIIKYLDDRYKFWHRWIGALTKLNIPCHVCWAKNDPVAVAAIGQQVANETPTATLTWVDRMGHYGMVEDPKRWLEPLMSYWAGLKKRK